MATLFSSGFEAGNIADWYDDSSDWGGSAPPVVSTDKFEGTYSLSIDDSAGPKYVRWYTASGPSVVVIRCYVKCVDTSEVSETETVFSVKNPAQDQFAEIQWSMDGSGVITMRSKIDDGVTPVFGTPTATLSKDVWYRVEAKFDFSGSSAKVTWGYAIGNGSLTTVETDFTGGNAYGADTGNWFLFGMNNWSDFQELIDAVVIADSGYPLGGLVSLDTVLPDADVTTTGWTTTPLYSKVNDSSDATVIQATAS